MLMVVIHMLNGLLFYWFGWMLWIVVTFLMPNSKLRTKLACWILTAILCSNIHVNIGSHRISVTFLILFSVAIILHAQFPRIVYHTFISFIITIGYTAILLWEQNTPIWLFVPRFILIPMISVMMINILIKDVYYRLVIGLVGFSAGELTFHMMLTSYGLHTSIGEMAYLDTLTVTIVIIIFLNILQWGRIKFFSLISNNKRPWMLKLKHRRYRSSS